MKKTQIQKVLEVMEENFLQWKPAHFYVGVRKGIRGNVFLSYKAPARLSEIYRIFTDHIERRQEIREGSRYYSYKLIKKVYESK